MLTQKDLFAKEEKSENGFFTREMTPTKINAFLFEFPWVLRYVERPRIIQVYVTRVEPQFLNYVPDRPGDDCMKCPERLFFLDAKGEECLVLEYGPWKTHWFGSGQYRKIKDVVPSSKIHGPVSRILVELGDQAQRVAYILSHSHLTRSVIVYKVPGNLKITEWILQETAKEAEIFRQEILAIG